MIIQDPEMNKHFGEGKANISNIEPDHQEDNQVSMNEMNQLYLSAAALTGVKEKSNYHAEPIGIQSRADYVYSRSSRN